MSKVLTLQHRQIALVSKNVQTEWESVNPPTLLTILVSWSWFSSCPYTVFCLIHEPHDHDSLQDIWRLTRRTTQGRNFKLTWTWKVGYRFRRSRTWKCEVSPPTHPTRECGLEERHELSQRGLGCKTNFMHSDLYRIEPGRVGGKDSRNFVVMRYLRWTKVGQSLPLQS